MLESDVPRWELFRALSEPIRLRLLALAAEEELAVGELAELLDEGQPNISRHATSLRQHELLVVRKEGTRTLLRLRDGAAEDPVVSEALRAGKALCEKDGSLMRVAELVSARDKDGRELFSQARAAELEPPTEMGAYLFALAPLVSERDLAVDVGTGHGGFLEVLAPIFRRVVAIDRADAQIENALSRTRARGISNVKFVRGDLDAPEVIAAVGAGASVVVASRIVHHAPRPARFVAQLADLCKPGGRLLLLDYLEHQDESMRKLGDVWLGFGGDELRGFAKRAGLAHIETYDVPKGLTGRGPDGHLPWQLLSAVRPMRDARPHTHRKK